MKLPSMCTSGEIGACLTSIASICLIVIGGVIVGFVFMELLEYLVR